MPCVPWKWRRCSTACGTAAPIPQEETTALYETLLLNQFHDILPGTSLKEVHELAIQENYQVARDAGRLAGDLLMARGTPGQSLTLFNTLSWSYTRQVTVPYEGLVPAALPYQRFTDRKGAEQLVIGGLDIPPLSTLTIAMTEEKRAHAALPLPGWRAIGWSLPSRKSRWMKAAP